MAGRDISFELERFEWVSPERLEVEGAWHGVRRLVRATLVIEVDGDTRRLRALPQDPGTPEQWTAAFAWRGSEMPKLQGAELEVGRSIVVDLPRPRTSKARGETKTLKPIPATTRADKTNEAALEQVRAEKESEKGDLLAQVTRLEAEAAAAVAAAQEATADRDSLRERIDEAASGEDALRAELDTLRSRVDAVDAERTALREERDTLRAEHDALRSHHEALEARAQEAAAGADAARAEHETLRARARDVESLRARVEDAEAQRDALRAQADQAVDLRNELEMLRAELDARSPVTPDVARLRAELESVERERTQLRAQLDATQPMPSPVPDEAPAADPRERLRQAKRFDQPSKSDELAAEAGRRRARRPAERTAKRASSPAPAASFSDKVTDWVGSVMGARDEEEGTTNGDTGAKPRSRARPEPTEAHPAPARTAAAVPAHRASPGASRRPRQAGVTHAEHHEPPSWPLRVAALGLTALLLITLIVILSSIL